MSRRHETLTEKQFPVWVFVRVCEYFVCLFVCSYVCYISLSIVVLYPDYAFTLFLRFPTVRHFLFFQFLLYNMSLELGSPHTYTQLSMKQVNIVHKNGRLQYEN
jgi:hypothetical protein